MGLKDYVHKSIYIVTAWKETTYASHTDRQKDRQTERTLVNTSADN